MSNANRSRRTSVGVEVHHEKACRSRNGGRCNCTPSYRGFVPKPGGGKLRGPYGPSAAAAANWRADQLQAIRRGTFIEPTTITLRQAADEFLNGAEAGHILTRSGKRYKPSTLRGYARGLRLHVLPVLGSRSLSQIRRADVQAFVDQLVRDGLDGSTVKNALDPLRRVCDRALKRDLIAINPTLGLEAPHARGRRERVASVAEADTLLAALPDTERGVWAMKFYAGLRTSEARALRCSDIDLDADVIHVQRGWDDVEGELDETKTEAGRRTVGVIPELRSHLVRHLMLTGRRGDDLVFGRTTAEPYVRSTVRARALRAWNAAGLEPIKPHECRHTFASAMRAANVDAGEVMRQMGHSGTAILDRYTHALPGSIDAARESLQAYIDGERKRATG